VEVGHLLKPKMKHLILLNLNLSISLMQVSSILQTLDNISYKRAITNKNSRKLCIKADKIKTNKWGRNWAT